MSWTNFGKVSYIIECRPGFREAQRTIQALRSQLTLDVPSDNRILAAARLRAKFRLAYADTFAMTTAIAHTATLLTRDPEIIDGNPDWPVLDLR